MAKLFHLALCNQWKVNTDAAEKLGNVSATMFYCKNYMSPLYKDNDAVWGLSAQYWWDSLTDYSEYGFIYSPYQRYFVTQPNCLWYIPLSFYNCA